MDTNTLNAYRKQMMKEQRMEKRWALEAEIREQNRPKDPNEIQLPPPRVLTRSSSAMHFLEQKLGLEPNPHLVGAAATTEDMLYFGVSSEGQGRSAYLKRRSQLDPKNKSMFPTQESLEVGWRSRAEEPNSSAFSRRPIVQNSFFRKQGVPLKTHHNPIRR